MVRLRPFGEGLLVGGLVVAQFQDESLPLIRCLFCALIGLGLMALSVWEKNHA